MRQDKGAPYKDGWERVGTRDLHIGDEVVVERKHFDYKKGFPIESDYFRTVVHEHKTVAGMALILVSEPTFEFPVIPPWQGNWTYAGNGMIEQMWRRT